MTKPDIWVELSCKTARTPRLQTQGMPKTNIHGDFPELTDFIFAAWHFRQKFYIY